MTQIVLMLYEDPKADPLSEHRFHVEMHFCPGAKTMDDPEFLTRSSPTRKRSEEEMRYSAPSAIPTDIIDTDSATKMSNIIDDIAKLAHDKHSKGVSSTAALSVDTLHSGVKTSSPCVVTTTSNPAPSAESSRSVVSSITTVRSPDLVSLEEEVVLQRDDFEPYTDKPFDETVYAGNERPRCAIGIENYSDTALGASTGDSAPSSGTSIEESSGEERVVTRQRNSLSESELHQTSRSESELHQTSVSQSELVDGVKDKSRSKSDSDIHAASMHTPTKASLQGCHDTSTVIVEEDESEPSVRNTRPKSHSVSGSHPVCFTTSSSRSSSSESPDDFSVHKFSQGMVI